MQNFIVLALVGLAAQLVDGSLGMAYGVTSTTLLLTTGFAPAASSASVHLAEVGTTLLSGMSHRRFGNVDWRTVTTLAIPGALGAFVGAIVLSSLSTEVAKPWMAGVLLALGVFVLVRFSTMGAPRRKGRAYVRKRHLAPLGLVAGLLDATGGGGWGPVATPSLLATGKMEPRKVVGSVDTSEFLVALGASLGFLIGLAGQGIAWRPVLALLLGGTVAAPIAAWLVRHVAPRLLGASVGGVVVLTNLRTLLATAGVGGAARTLAYAVVLVTWATAAVAAVGWHRREDAAAWGAAPASR
ncbi:MAG: sulfite exporter TauE/SafE family protein [Actinomycetota bacterium]|nr:sulfite exporter TauE/SafE family protein [Actinomycetota bacterium]